MYSKKMLHHAGSTGHGVGAETIQIGWVLYL